MTVLFALAVAVLPIGGVPDGSCVQPAALADLQPQGAGQTFASRHTIFAHDFAYTRWYEHETGGGEILWRKHGERWCSVPLKGAYLDQQTFERLGVPANDARGFRIEGAKYLEAIVIFRRREPTSKPEDQDDK